MSFNHGKTGWCSFALVFLCVWVLLIQSANWVEAFAAVPGQESLATFAMEDRFGVTHPEQIVYFDLPGGLPSEPLTLRDAHGTAVPFQIMADKRLALRTDLPAGASCRWTLHADATEMPRTNAVSLKQNDDGIEIDNGLLAIRLPLASAGLDPTPSPIQGLRDRDGMWMATGPNIMHRPATSMTVDVLEAGPLVARVMISYVFSRALLRSHLPELPEIPAGEGYYRVIVELQAGQPVILFEEDCEVDIGYSIRLSDGWLPDRARYRGHHATSPEAGREPDGKVYRQGHQRPAMDAEIDLAFDRNKDPHSMAAYRFMSHWDPWSVNTGYYWQLYDSRAGGGDRLVGIFAGPAEWLIRPGVSGVAVDTAMVDGKPAVGLRIGFRRLMPTQQYTTRMRFAWGLFMGRKSADLRPATEVQTIGRMMNLHSGVNLNDLKSLPVEYPEPPAGFGSLYIPAEILEPLKAELRAEKQAGGPRPRFQTLYNVTPHYRDLFEFWSDASAEGAEQAAAAIIEGARKRLDVYVNGHGIHNHRDHYFMGAMMKSQHLVWLDQLLGSKLLTADTRKTLKQVASLYATLLWSHNVAPMQRDANRDNLSGMNWGPANMASMWLGTRYGYTLLLANHPLFAPRVSDVKDETRRLIHDYVHNDGAVTASVHYSGASMIPILNLILQLQRAEAGDLCATEPRLRRYAEWELQVMTPPEIRFGGLRKMVAIGDGATESSSRLAPLGTAFAKADPRISARLMWAWQAMGRPLEMFFGQTLLRTDPNLPTTAAELGDDQFEGYFSVFRHAFDTPAETALWFINGDWYSDHRHNDAGSFVYYALGAPLSLDWGSMYAPRTAGGMMHNMVLPERALTSVWDQDGVSLSLPAGGSRANWLQVETSPLASFTESAWNTTEFKWDGHTAPDLRWRRSVRLLRANPDCPMLLIEDTVSDGAAELPVVVSTFNMMATGDVQTATGPVSPPLRLYDNRDAQQQDLPSALPSFKLQAGLSRFGFTGQWGVDWDLIVDAPEAWQATVGNWAHRWHPGGEQNQFRQAQDRPFEERQHMLRLRGAGGTRVLMLPYRAGNRPEPFSAEKTNGRLVVQTGASVMEIGAHGFAHLQGGVLRAATAFGEPLFSGHGVTLQGGPMEVVFGEAEGALTVSGTAGLRRVGLPPTWRIDSKDRVVTAVAAEAANDGARMWIIDYKGDKTLQLPLKR